MSANESDILKELRRRKNERLKSSIEFGTGQNPDTYAKTLSSANKLGVPIDVAERNADAINKLANESEILEKLRDSHATRRMFQNPDTAAIAHDDVDGLIKVERTVKALGAGATKATLGVSESIWRTPEALGRFSDAINQGLGINKLSAYLKKKGAPDWLVSTKNPLLEMMTKGVDVGDQHFAGTSNIADKINKSQGILSEEFETFRRIDEKGRAADLAFDEALKGNLSPLSDVLTDPEAWAGFIGQAAPSLYMSYKSGGSIPFIAWLESMEVATDAAEFEKMTGQSVDPIAFTQATAQVAILNSFLEKFSLDRVFGNRGNGVLSSMIKSAVTEGGTEMLQEFNTNVAKYLAYNPDQKLSEGVLGAGMGGFGSGAGGGTVSALGRASGPKSKFARNIGKAQKAFDDAEKMTAAVEAVQELKTKDRDAKAVKTFLDDVLGAEEEVYIPAEDAQVFFQSHPEVMKDLPEEIAESIQESMWMNNDVAMDKSDYLTYLSKYHEELSESLRNDMDGMNVAEANEWIDKGQDEFDAAAEKILAEQEITQEAEASADRVAQTIKEQNVRTGRFTEDTAERYARLHRASAIAIGERLGKTPEQVYQELGLRITAAPIVKESGTPVDVLTQEAVADSLGIEVDELTEEEYQRAVTEYRSRLQAEKDIYTTLSGRTAKQGWAEATGVRRADGRPATVYRGSETGLKERSFAPERLGGITKNPSAGLGVWFSSSAEEAGVYGQKVEPFHLNIKNPKIIKIEDLQAFDTIQHATEFREDLRAQGFDGIVIDARHVDGPVHFVAFDPDQVITTEPETYFQDAQRNNIGLYSAVEQAVIDTKLPAWNKAISDGFAVYAPLATGYAERFDTEPEAKEWLKERGFDHWETRELIVTVPANNKEIWSKITKTPGVKKEEIEWLGLEDYLKSKGPKGKFTREEVLEFVRNNGIHIEQVTAEEAAGEAEINWGEGEIWDDPEAWEHNVEDMLYSFDQGESDAIWIDIDRWMRGWLEDNIDSVVANYEVSLPDDAVEELNEITDSTEKITYLENSGYDVAGDMRQEARDDFEKYANEQARDSYMDDPQYIYHAEVGDNDLYIFGNDEYGYTVRRDNWEFYSNVVASDVYSLGEAEIQAADWARDQGWLADEESPEVARWAEHVMEGPHDNYRELKLTLPEISPEFYEEAHFPDANIVAFLRVDDRDLKAPLTEAQKVQPSGFDDVMDEARRERNTYFIDEFQSDWHQQGRKIGYATGKDAGELEEKRYELVNEIRDELISHLQLKMADVDNSDIERAFEVIRNNGEPPTGLDDVDVYNESTRIKYKNLADIITPHVVDNFLPRIKEADALAKQVEAERHGVPDAPWKGDAWISLGLKRALIDAVENDYEAIAWPNAEVLMDRWSSRYKEMYYNQYNKKMPSIIKKLTKQKPQHLDQNGEPVSHEELGYWIVELTPELKEKIRSEGFTLFQEARGQIQFGDEAIITLLEGADLSTFLHETGHFYFEALNKFAETNKEIAEDMQVLLDHIGVADRSTWNNMSFEERREGHEKVARSFEAYLFEGKAPSMELRTLFQRFRDWLINIYRQLSNLNVDLTDEVRGVFDRMLATEEQLRAKKVADAYEAVFESAEDAGMTEKQWQEYQEMNKNRQAKAQSELEQRSLKDMKWLDKAKSRELRRLQNEARQKRKAMYAEVQADVENEHIYRSIKFLRTGETKDAEGNTVKLEEHKLDLDTVKDMYEGAKPKPGPVDTTVDNIRVAIAKLGGISRAEAELQGIDPETFNSPENQPMFGKRVFVKEGDTFDGMAEKLVELGYLTDRDPNKLLDKLDDSLRGNEQYSMNADYMKIHGLEADVEWTKLGKGKTGMLAKDGISPDIAAQMLGYSSGDSMIRQILEAEPIRERIDRLTDSRMMEAYGDINSPAALERAANEALHNEAHTRFLHTELKAMSKGTGTGNVLSRAAKNFAERSIARKKIKNIKPYQYSVAESRAGKAAEKAHASGDRASAVEHKRAQVLNNHFFRAANNARNETEKMLRFLKRFTKEGTRKNIDQDYIDQIDSMLEHYDLKKGVSLKELERRKSIREWSEAQENLGFTPIIDESLLEASRKKHYKEMTFEEFSGLADSIRNIEHLGRLKKTLLRSKDKREFAAIIAEADQSIRDNANRTVKERGEPTDVLGVLEEWGRNLAAIHRKFASFVREMDGGKDNGVLYKLLTRGMSESGDIETEMSRQDTLALNELFEPIMGDIAKGGVPFNFSAKKYAIPNTNISMSKEQLLMFGMNWGNEGNRQRLRDGGITGQRSLSQQEIDSILSMLTKQDWDFIQGVLDYIGTKREEIGKQEKRLTGVEPEWVEPAPIDTKYGTYPGGYFPAKYDVTLSTRSEMLDAVNDIRMAMKGAFNSATTRKSHTMKRAKEVSGRPLVLSFNAISRHLNEVNHRLAWQDWLVDANRILNALDSPIREHYGPEVLRELRDTVRDIAEGDIQVKNAWEIAINRLRVGSTIVGMGWRFTTAIIQPTGLAQSWARIGGKWMNKGIKRYLANPLEAGRIADEKSVMMKNRALTMQREVNEVLNTVKAGKKLTQFKASMFYFIQKMQRTVDIPTWWGAYEKAMSDLQMETAQTAEQRAEIEAAAIEIANQTVKDTQSSGLIGDLAKVQRGSAFAKLFTNFYSYFSATYNLNVEVFRRTDFSKPKDLMLFAQDMLILNVVPVILSVALRELLKNECDMELDCLGEKLAQEQLSFLLGQTLPTREMGASAGALLGLDTFPYKGPAGLRPLLDIYSLGVQAGQGEMDAAFWKSANKVAGATIHYPAGQVQSTVEGFMAVQNGEVEGVGAVQALLAGPPK